jgi:broad specificity phosphatase PhoE
MKIIVVRHGQTGYNKDRRYMGHLDVGLSKDGQEQARRLAERLAGEKIHFIYSSDLERAKQTLGHITTKHGNVPVHFDPQLRERKLGAFEGKLRSEVDWDSVPGNHLAKKPPGGESLSDMKGRVNRFLKHLKDRHRGETVLLVTHGGTIRVINHLLMRESLVESFERYKIKNTAVCIYDMTDKKPRIICFNDASHLDGAQALSE